MVCRNCGYQSTDDAVFCPNCGTSLQPQCQPVQPQYQPAQPQYQPVQPQYPPMQPQYQYPQQYPYQPQYQPQPQPREAVPGRGLGVASMVLGIISLALFCILYVSIPCAIIGLILGIAGKISSGRAGSGNGMAAAGILCSTIFIAIVILCVTYLSTYYDEIIKNIF